MTEIGGGEGWGVGISSLHFLLVWPDGTIVDGHADNWDWKLVARINYRLFLPHIQLWGCSEKRNRKKFLFLFGLSQGTSRPPPVTLVKPQKNNLRRCGEGSEGCVTLHTSKGGSSKGCRLIRYFVVWCVISVLPVLVAWGGFVQIPLRWVPSIG